MVKSLKMRVDRCVFGAGDKVKVEVVGSLLKSKPGANFEFANRSVSVRA